MTSAVSQEMQPSAWVILQVAALFVAAAAFLLRTSSRDRELRATFACALPFTALGALAFDYALRVTHYAATSFAGAAPRVGGVMAYGALFGLAIAYGLGAWAFAACTPARALDRAAPSFGLLVFVARLGCLAEGCEHGRATSLPWAWHYAATHPRFAILVNEGLAHANGATSLGMHPTPLYEGLVGLAASLAALLVEKRSARAGGAFAAAAFTYAVGRFIVEFFRADAGRGAAGPFTTGQAVSLFVACAVVAWCFRAEAESQRPPLPTVA